MLNLIFRNEFSLDDAGKSEKYITKLENLIIDYNSELLMGNTWVDDATYTNCIELLEMLRSDSPVLKNDREVKFIKDLNSDIVSFIENQTEGMEVLKFYLNPQGLNVKLIYESGKLVEAYTFGRSLKRQNVLDLMITVMTDSNDNLSDLERVEIEGCLVIAFENIDMAKEYCVVKNPYQGLFSLLAYDATHEGEIDNLEDIIHFIATDIKIEGTDFETVDEKYAKLMNLAFLTPVFFEMEKSDNLLMDLDDALFRAENEKSMYEYPTDGVRLVVLDDEVIIFKIGSWKITSFEGIVDKVDWIEDKCRKLPVLKLRESVDISEDYSITEIVLNSINLLLILNIEIGKPIKFAYFGGMGILPITRNEEIILN